MNSEKRVHQRTYEDVNENNDENEQQQTTNELVNEQSQPRTVKTKRTRIIVTQPVKHGLRSVAGIWFLHWGFSASGGPWGQSGPNNGERCPNEAFTPPMQQY